MADVFPAADFARLRASQMADAEKAKEDARKRKAHNDRVIANMKTMRGRVMPKISLRGEETEQGYVLVAQDEDTGNMAGVLIDKATWDVAENKEAAWKDILGTLEQDISAQTELADEPEAQPSFH
ncbi:hypothetical protein HOS13_gp15 [Caulobacter phage Lullwater]|uniref:Uncharacterized protein n=1 Tax=Caulobacter phage Lullwater TaxID=2024607 RepID=A0A291LB17_9CAUD|nr:hypothetical protein HOS13_gp15 [Caulobacter phage Lullwater]ATI16322.1 hypothetical protein Lull_015 [Caulobacter phage Lullwater]